MIIDKRKFGELQVFKNLIIFCHDNGQGKSGLVLVADLKEEGLRQCVIEALRYKPELAQYLKECITASEIVLPARMKVIQSKDITQDLHDL